MNTTSKTKPLPSSARTVTVACKVETGLVLQLQRQVDRLVDTPKGPETKQFWVKTGQGYEIHGPAIPRGQMPKGYRPPIIVGGYALTPGIPADFWEQWLEQNKNSTYCAPVGGSDHGFIFAYPDLESATSAAEENEALLTGFQPLSTDVDKHGSLIDKRIPRPVHGKLGRVQPEDRAA